MAKQIIAPAPNTLVGGSSKLFEASGDLIKGAIQRLMDRAIESGDVCPDLDPFRSAADSRQRLKRRVRTGPAAERKGDGRDPSPGFLPIKENHFSHHERSDRREKVRPQVVILI